MMITDRINASRPGTDIFVPSDKPLEEALGKTTHLAIVAHQDDAEIGAFDGIRACVGKQDKGFGCVIVTDGAGSPKDGPYAGTSPQDMIAIRRQEQRDAAKLGGYTASVQLNYPSAVIKGTDTSEAGLAEKRQVIDKIKAVLDASRPEVVYLHSPFDKHESHLASTEVALRALKELKQEKGYVPKQVLGVEVWRKHDWILQESDLKKSGDKNPRSVLVQQPLTREDMALQARLIKCFKSQIVGAKDYIGGALGIETCNNAFADPHQSSLNAKGMLNMVDMTPIAQGAISYGDYVGQTVDQFVTHAKGAVSRYSPDNSLGKRQDAPAPYQKILAGHPKGPAMAFRAK